MERETSKDAASQRTWVSGDGERERPQTRSSLWMILEATDREYLMKGREVWAGAEGRLHRLQGREEIKARSRF